MMQSRTACLLQDRFSSRISQLKRTPSGKRLRNGSFSGRGASPLKRRRLDDSIDQDGRATVLSLEPVDDVVNRLLIAILNTSPQCECEHLFRYAAIEIGTPLSHKNFFEFPNSVERLPRG